MDISIRAHHNLDIRLEISHFDTVADIKQKLQSLTGIAAFRQTLFFNNALLQETSDVAGCNLFDNSRVRLLIRQPAFIKSPPDPVFKILIRNPISKRHFVTETTLDSAVSNLKQTVVESSLVSADLFTLFLFGKEMDETASSLRGVSGIERGDAVVEMVLVYGGGRNNCMPGTTAKVTVALVPVNLKVTVTVTLSHCFGELRREMERLRKEKKVELPENWMFVYRKEKVLIENAASFEEFKVVDDDVIHIHSLVVV
ncbi:unnamed protein product [Rhodiola kirilowii]